MAMPKRVTPLLLLMICPLSNGQANRKCPGTFAVIDKDLRHAPGLKHRGWKQGDKGPVEIKLEKEVGASPGPMSPALKTTDLPSALKAGTVLGDEPIDDEDKLVNFVDTILKDSLIVDALTKKHQVSSRQDLKTYVLKQAEDAVGRTKEQFWQGKTKDVKKIYAAVAAKFWDVELRCHYLCQKTQDCTGYEYGGAYPDEYFQEVLTFNFQDFFQQGHRVDLKDPFLRGCIDNRDDDDCRAVMKDHSECIVYTNKRVNVAGPRVEKDGHGQLFRSCIKPSLICGWEGQSVTAEDPVDLEFHDAHCCPSGYIDIEENLGGPGMEEHTAENEKDCAQKCKKRDCTGFKFNLDIKQRLDSSGSRKSGSLGVNCVTFTHGERNIAWQGKAKGKRPPSPQAEVGWASCFAPSFTTCADSCKRAYPRTRSGGGKISRKHIIELDSPVCTGKNEKACEEQTDNQREDKTEDDGWYKPCKWQSADSGLSNPQKIAMGLVNDAKDKYEWDPQKGKWEADDEKSITIKADQKNSVCLAKECEDIDIKECTHKWYRQYDDAAETEKCKKEIKEKCENVGKGHENNPKKVKCAWDKEAQKCYEPWPEKKQGVINKDLGVGPSQDKQKYTCSSYEWDAQGFCMVGCYYGKRQLAAGRKQDNWVGDVGSCWAPNANPNYDISKDSLTGLPGHLGCDLHHGNPYIDSKKNSILTEMQYTWLGLWQGGRGPQEFFKSVHDWIEKLHVTEIKQIIQIGRELGQVSGLTNYLSSFIPEDSLFWRALGLFEEGGQAELVLTEVETVGDGAEICLIASDLLAVVERRAATLEDQQALPYPQGVPVTHTSRAVVSRDTLETVVPEDTLENVLHEVLPENRSWVAKRTAETQGNEILEVLSDWAEKRSEKRAESLWKQKIITRKNLGGAAKVGKDGVEEEDETWAEFKKDGARLVDQALTLADKIDSQDTPFGIRWEKLQDGDYPADFQYERKGTNQPGVADELLHFTQTLGTWNGEYAFGKAKNVLENFIGLRDDHKNDEEKKGSDKGAALPPGKERDDKELKDLYHSKPLPWRLCPNAMDDKGQGDTIYGGRQKDVYMAIPQDLAEKDDMGRRHGLKIENFNGNVQDCRTHCDAREECTGFEYGLDGDPIQVKLPGMATGPDLPDMGGLNAPKVFCNIFNQDWSVLDGQIGAESKTLPPRLDRTSKYLSCVKPRGMVEKYLFDCEMSCDYQFNRDFFPCARSDEGTLRCKDGCHRSARLLSVYTKYYGHMQVAQFDGAKEAVAAEQTKAELKEQLKCCGADKGGRPNGEEVKDLKKKVEELKGGKVDCNGWCESAKENYKEKYSADKLCKDAKKMGCKSNRAQFKTRYSDWPDWGPDRAVYDTDPTGAGTGIGYDDWRHVSRKQAPTRVRSAEADNTTARSSEGAPPPEDDASFAALVVSVTALALLTLILAVALLCSCHKQKPQPIAGAVVLAAPGEPTEMKSVAVTPGEPTEMKHVEATPGEPTDVGNSPAAV